MELYMMHFFIFVKLVFLKIYGCWSCKEKYNTKNAASFEIGLLLIC